MHAPGVRILRSRELRALCAPHLGADTMSPYP